MASRRVLLLGESACPPRVVRADDLGGLRRRAAEAHSLSRPLRRLPCAARFGVEDLLVRFDNNKYSVSAGAVGRPVDIHAYADRIVIRQDGRIVGEHHHSFGCGETVYDPWRYVPVLARKPGALRNGAAVEAACLQALSEGVHSADVILNILLNILAR